VYFEPSLLPFLENILGGRHVNFRPLQQVFFADIPCPAFIVISGTIDFFSKLQRVIRDQSTVIWFMQQSFFNVKPRYFQNRVNQAASLSRSVGLHPVKFFHRMYGGATNALHLISFGSAFGFHKSEFVHPPNVQRTLRYFWKPAESVPVKVCSGFPVVDGDQQRPLMFNGCLRVEG
jgi:hypothetical protein